MSQPSSLPNQNALGASDRHLLTPNESLKGDPIVTPRIEKELAYAPAGAVRTRPPQSSRGKWLVTATIVGGWIVAVAFALGHYHYGVINDGCDIPANPTDALLFAVGGQDSIKSAINALTRGVVLALTISAGATLAQLAWSIPSTRPVTLEQMDNIIKLPSPAATFVLMTSGLFRYILPVTLLVICVQILEAVTIMAPQSLKIAPGLQYTALANVTSLNFTHGPMVAADIFSGAYAGPSSSWLRIVQKAMMTPVPVSIPSPSSCAGGCSYTIYYKAPNLNCTHLAASDLTPHTGSGPQTLYSGSSSLWPALNGTNTDTGVLVPYFTSNQSDHTTPYTIRMEWSGIAFDGSSPSSATPDSPRGVECTFYESDYSAFLWFNGTIQAFSPQALTLDQPLSGQLATGDSCGVTPDATKPCWVGGINFRATAEAFSRLILGTIVYNPAGSLQVTSGTPDLLPLFDTNTTLVGQTASWNFNSTVPDMATALQDMICNVTIALVGARNDMANANVTYEAAGIVWQFDDWVLWAIYGPTLAVFGLFSLYGIWCVWRDGVADTSFSGLLVATRGESIDRAVSAAKDPEAIMNLRVKYDRRGEFEMQKNDDQFDV